jgi:protein gp37
MKHGDARQRTAESTWRNPIAWNARAEREGRRIKVFCLSLGDWLDEHVPIAWRTDLLDLIRQTPCLDWQLLTKRPQNWWDLVSASMKAADASGRIELGSWLSWWLDTGGNARPPENVWIGVTVENQYMADARIRELIEIPALVRFLSCEPLLEPLDLSYWLTDPIVPQLDWVICGGETGDKKDDVRAMHPKWAQSLRDQCGEVGVPFFFKQWGDWAHMPERAHLKGVCAEEWRRLESDMDGIRPALMFRVGKAKSGNLLDGKEWGEFPKKMNRRGTETQRMPDEPLKKKRGTNEDQAYADWSRRASLKT